MNQLKENQTTLLAEKQNLTNLNNNLISDFENLRRDNDDLKVQRDILTRAHNVSVSEIAELKAEIQDLEEQREELKDLNISRAQWSIDNYCPKRNDKRECRPCQKGWTHFTSGCYAINDVPSKDKKTWREAQEHCMGIKSNLTVIVHEDERKFVIDNSWGIQGYWIGLRVEGGRWKWVDGSDLANESWIRDTAQDNHCAISVQGKEWKSVSCDNKQRWICKKAALSL